MREPPGVCGCRMLVFPLKAVLVDEGRCEISGARGGSSTKARVSACSRLHRMMGEYSEQRCKISYTNSNLRL